MQYRPEEIIDLPLVQKKQVVIGFKRGDEVDILDALSKHGLLTIPLPIGPQLREILKLSVEELYEKTVSANLSTNVTWGDAVVQYYKYLLCRAHTEDITFYTTQTFRVSRSQIGCNSEAALLAFGRSDVVVDESEYNSQQFAALLERSKHGKEQLGSEESQDEDYVPSEEEYVSSYSDEGSSEEEATSASLHPVHKPKESVSAKVQSEQEEPKPKKVFPKDTSDFLARYNEACKIEDDMRANMYVTRDPKYYEEYYNLYEINYLDNLPQKKHITRELLFRKSKLKLRDIEDTNKSLAWLDIILSGETNVLVAGGSVFSAIFESKANDYDLFIHGVDEKEATNICRRLVENISPTLILRTPNALTLYTGHGIGRPHTTVQIVLRLYSTISEVLHGFDVDSCCLGYDGERVWATERAKFAIEHGTNTVNFDRLSPSYEYRLVKYALRGMSVYVPDFDPERVTEIPKERNKFDLRTTEGLSILLFMNNRYAKQLSVETMNKHAAKSTSDYDPLESGGTRLRDIMAAIDDDTKVPDLVFSNVLHGWPNNDIAYVKGLYEDYDSVVNIPTEVVKAFKTYATQENRDIVWSLPKVMTWKTTKPGEQMTNTFHKTVLEDKSQWYIGKYYK